MTDASRSAQVVLDAIAALPAALDAAEAVEVPAFPLGAQPITSGVGASEGPARMLAARLLARGLAARFVPIANLEAHTPRPSAVVLFSQGLSPNARHALAATSGVPTLLVTSRPEADGSSPPTLVRLVVPPATEAPALVRFVGPTVASAVAIRLASALCGEPPPQGAGAAYLAGLARGHRLPRRLAALVSVGLDPEDLFGHRWKLLEALRAPGLFAVDALSLTHGPLQSLAPDAGLLVLAASAQDPLLARLRASVAGRPLVVLEAGAGPYAALTAAAALDEAIARLVAAEGLDLLDWPGRGAESALYELGRS